MPATHRNITRVTGPSTRGAQSRLTFGSHSKVTKPSLPTQTKKVLTRTPTPECILVTKVGEVALEQAKGEVPQLHKAKEEEDVVKVSDAQVKRYWKAVEDERKAPRSS